MVVGEMVLETPVSGQRTPYQPLLRALGAELDARSATQVTVVELSDGFLARFLRAHALITAEVAEWPLSWLMQRSEELRHTRARFRGRQRPAQSQYQDLFRAVGYELDQVPAYSLALDELEDRLLLTYLHHNPHSGYVLLKRLVVLGEDERRQLLLAAQGRRAKRRFF
jgi:hypothetical protein